MRRVTTAFPQVVFALALTPFLLRAEKKVASPVSTASNDNVEIRATIFMTEEEVTSKLGADPGKGIVMVEMRITPKGDNGLRVGPDDFYLLSHNDGQRSQPYGPEQLAGKGGLVLHQQAGSGGGLSRTPGAPIGRNSTGRVQRMPGAGNGIGNMGSAPGELKADKNSDSKSDDALLEKIKEKQFPDTVAKDEVSGYLLFPLDGKHKLKNMAVLYRGPGGRLDIEFEH